MFGDPAALGAEDALQNNRPVAGVDEFVQGYVPTRRGIERVEHALHTVARLVVQREPATAHDAAGLANLLRDQVRAGPSVRLIGIERAPFLAILEIVGWFLAAGALRFHAATGNQLAQHLAQHRAPLV